MSRMNEQQFCETLQSKLGSFWDRGLTTFRNYGERFGYDLATVLLRAADQGKVEEILNTLEDHYRNHLAYQHPEIRGTIEDRILGANITEVMFRRIFQQTRKPQPTS